MAREYFEKLSALIGTLDIQSDSHTSIEVKHFFNGAALYVNNVICVSWSPAGLAFKLPENEVMALIDSGKAKPLKYFPKGHVKRGYALFESPEKSKSNRWKAYFITAIAHNDI